VSQSFSSVVGLVPLDEIRGDTVKAEVEMIVASALGWWLGSILFIVAADSCDRRGAR
jgi:hypothetical protein